MPAAGCDIRWFGVIVCDATLLEADDANDGAATALFNDEVKLSWRSVSGGDRREAIDKGLCFGGGVASAQEFIV